jgi:hypothetical protein
MDDIIAQMGGFPRFLRVHDLWYNLRLAAPVLEDPVARGGSLRIGDACVQSN